ncbi:hypothetical protein BU17DRAFT_67144 [Hysterangium stoloniferum]|nr:hypothetical protein BU17DRAFT_67144 [Hysterangium stoloniferum]
MSGYEKVFGQKFHDLRCIEECRIGNFYELSQMMPEASSLCPFSALMRDLWPEAVQQWLLDVDRLFTIATTMNFMSSPFSILRTRTARLGNMHHAYLKGKVHAFKGSLRRAFAALRSDSFIFPGVLQSYQNSSGKHDFNEEKESKFLTHVTYSPILAGRPGSSVIKQGQVPRADRYLGDMFGAAGFVAQEWEGSLVSWILSLVGTWCFRLPLAEKGSYCDLVQEHTNKDMI